MEFMLNEVKRSGQVSPLYHYTQKDKGHSRMVIRECLYKQGNGIFQGI